MVKLHYHFESPNPGRSSELVSFFFHWVNPSPYATTIMVDGYMILNGTTRAVVNGYWPVSENRHQTNFDLYALLNVAALWTSPPTSIGGGLEQQVYVGVETEGIPIVGYQHSAAVNTDVFKGVDVRTIPLPGSSVPPQAIRVPANSAMAVQLAMWILATTDGGSVDVDFSTGDFNVMTPGILITSFASVPVHTV